MVDSGKSAGIKVYSVSASIGYVKGWNRQLGGQRKLLVCERSVIETMVIVAEVARFPLVSNGPAALMATHGGSIMPDWFLRHSLRCNGKYATAGPIKFND